MATQWNEMGRDLLRVPLFKETIERCHKILVKKDLDLTHIITTKDESIFEGNVVNCMVGIGAVQIGMINILREIGLEPDFFIGTSFGEVATAYADGCFTEEQAILSAYYRGLVNSKGSSILGQIAFVGLTVKELQEMLPEDIDDAAHMDPNACCISGPKESLLNFVEKLKQQNRFTALPNCSNIAFHSRYIKKSGTLLLAHLQGLIPQPKFRSNKWLSTSVIPEKWSDPKAQVCSGEYFVNNFLGCVYLEETCRRVPKNSIVLEIAPHCLLRTTIKNNFTEGTHISLGDKKREDNSEVFLEALRSLSDLGVNVEWNKVNKVFENNNL